jgi:predicted nuclease of predicted toxin-antitoxin system
MKMLLDENIPYRLYRDFDKIHEVYSINFMGWNSYTNGELLKRMLSEKFEALITWDQNIAFQQNFVKYPITVFILVSPSNDYITLQPLISQIQEAIKQGIKTGSVTIMT